MCWHAGAGETVSLSTEVRIDAACGPLLGRADAGVLRLRGVPFAEPPLAERRDQPPQPIDPWHAPRPVLQAAPAPLQPDVFGLGMRSASRQAEDCLYLNVDAPLNARRAPVLVWLFGGGFITGDASDDLFDGSVLAQQGAVLVRSNYRLGALGRNNLGLLDQIAALRWVQQNIGAVGGDPGCVTLMGESAGAMSLCTLLTCPAASGLFHRAIAQSGAGRNVATAEQAARAEQAWQERLSAAPPPSDAALMRLQTEFSNAWREALGGMPFRPVIDGELLPEHPEAGARRGAAVPLLIGHNADEHRLYINPRRYRTWQQVEQALAERLPDLPLAEVRQQYPELEPAPLWAAIETERHYRQPIERYARARHAAHPGRTWRYRFNWPSPALRGWLRACHAIEIPFVFGTFSAPGTRKFVGTGYEALAGAVQRLWLHFARHGEPPPPWKPYPDTLELHPDVRLRPPDDPANALERYWNTRLGV